MEQALDVMKKQGATLVDPADIATFGKFDDSELLVFMYELKADLNAYLARLGPGAPVRTLQDIIEFNDRNRQKEMPYFGQDLFLKAQAKGPLTDKEYVDALAKNHQLARTEGIDALMDKYKLDAIVAPTGGPAWLTDLVNGDHVGWGQFQCGRGRGLSQHQCDRWFYLRLAGGDFILRPRLERAHADQAGLLVRAGHQSAAGAAILDLHRIG